MRILLTGGGTGGHIYPILAVAEKIKASVQSKNIEVKLYYIGSAGSYAGLLESNGIKVSGVISVKFRRYFDLRNILDIFKFPFALVQAFWKVFFLMPDVLFSKSGPGALAVVLACRFYRIPIIIHESDAVAGLTNLISSRYAERIGISFPSAQESFVNYFKSEKQKQKIINSIALVGNPVRSFLTNAGNMEVAKKSFGFDPQKPLILVICGSQGAVSINDFFLNSAVSLISENFQILHQTGAKNFDQFSKELDIVLSGLGDRKNFYKAVPYFENNMEDAYAAADLVVSRSGSGSIFEIAAMRKPSILIPLATSASDHQRKNAYEYAKSGAAVVIEESNFKYNIFISQLKKIFENPDMLKHMSEEAAEFSKPDSAQVIAEEIIRLGQK